MSWHSWEHLSSQAASPVTDDEQRWGSGDSDDEGDEARSVDPGEQFVMCLLGHYMNGRVSAQQCCTLMFWAEKAGIQAAAPYALPPSSCSGHGARKLNKVLGHKYSPDLYEAELAGHHRRDLDRTMHVTSFLPLHEQVADAMETDDSAFDRLAELKAAGDLPPVYTQHPVVVGNPDMPVLPYAIFMDAVPYSNTDSVLGLWGVDLLTQRRFLFGTLRKRHLCRCGCKGWCTYYVVHLIAAWSVEAMAAGKWPAQRHDGSDFTFSDRHRARRAGQPFRTKVAVLYLKGDWAEYSHTLGLPTWQDGLRPCMKCAGCGLDLYIAAGNAQGCLRWRCNAAGDYEMAASRSEIKVTLANRAEVDQIARLLFYDKRKKGGGRCLHADVIHHGLISGDRLEPSAELIDVGAFEESATPITVTFWRRAKESLTRHRNPLLRADLGLGADRCITIDSLHSLYLGVMNVWCRVAAWEILLSGGLGPPAYSEDTLATCCQVLRSRLFAWMGRCRESHPTEVLTRLQDLVPAMLGKHTDKKCKTKGSEIWTFLLFF